MEEVLDTALSERTTEPAVTATNGAEPGEVEIQDSGEAVETVAREGR
jgi:hypothetical protein